jgi:hypothetical protein
MKRWIVLTVLAILSLSVLFCCFFALLIGSVPLPPPPTPASGTPITEDPDGAYLRCSGQVQSDWADLLDEVADSVQMLDPNADDFCYWQPLWLDRMLEIQAAHALCTTPTNEQLQTMHNHVENSLAQYVLMVKYHGDHCNTSDPELLSLAAEQMGRGYWYMSQAHEQLKQYRKEMGID